MTAQKILADIALYGPYVVTALAAAMAVLPQGKPGSVWDTIRTIVNYVAMNWGHAKNVVENPPPAAGK